MQVKRCHKPYIYLMRINAFRLDLDSVDKHIILYLLFPAKGRRKEALFLGVKFFWKQPIQIMENNLNSKLHLVSVCLMRFCTTIQWKMERKIILFECLPDRKGKNYFSHILTLNLYVLWSSGNNWKRLYIPREFTAIWCMLLPFFWFNRSILRIRGVLVVFMLSD